MVAVKLKKTRIKTGVPILERTLDLLEYLSQRPEGITLSQIARDLKIPKNTTYRMLNTLCARGYVLRNEAELNYKLTRRVGTLVYSSAQDGSLIEKALPPMRKLRDQVKETVVISILDQHEGIVLEQIPGVHPFRFVCDPGTRQTLYTSASTKAILANLTDDELEPILKNIVYKRFTDNTIISETAFRKELAATKKRGYGSDCAEALHGVHCVAAPIFNRQGAPIAAITVTGPEERLCLKDFERVGRLTMACAATISESVL
ncbi:MAG: IclR family transcriptional regulator [Kiritimatiellae bacterium]|nr:IclR family transcriptional regulator [Kiritimatiellia bacterium]